MNIDKKRKEIISKGVEKILKADRLNGKIISNEIEELHQTGLTRVDAQNMILAIAERKI